MDKLNCINKIKELNQYNKPIKLNIKEVDFFKDTIKLRLGKEVKYLKKIYNESVDAESASSFH